MRRLGTTSAVIVTLGLLAAACSGDDGGGAGPSTSAGGTTQAGGGGDCESDDVLCVGLVTGVGKIDDKSFNQSAWEGVLAAQEDTGASVRYIETENATDAAGNVQQLLDDGFEVVVTVGAALGAATVEAARAHPDVDFIGVDQLQGESLPNLTGLAFDESKLGFLAGALAGLLTESGTVAAVLGSETVPAVAATREGFVNGVRYTNPEAEVISSFHPGAPEVGGSDPGWGAGAAREALGQGADIVFGTGGLTGTGALAEVAKEAGAALCIGADSDRWDTVPEAQPCLVTSTLKVITPGVARLIAASAAGSFPGGNVAGDVGLAPYHDLASKVPDGARAQMETIVAGVLDGSIPTRPAS
jgi:basic membrane protein A